MIRSRPRPDAQAFKEAFEKAQEDNSKAPKSESAPAPAAAEEKKEDKEDKTAAAAEADKVGRVIDESSGATPRNVEADRVVHDGFCGKQGEKAALESETGQEPVKPELSLEEKVVSAIE